MKQDEKKFGYRMLFRNFDQDKNSSSWKYFTNFACADTAGEVIANLAKIFDGSIPYRQLLGEGSEAKLRVIELRSDDRILITIQCVENTEKKTPARAQWSSMVFDEVNQELLDALMGTFPEQRQIFKGKRLESALGL
jgi:hypothetical protein